MEHRWIARKFFVSFLILIVRSSDSWASNAKVHEAVFVQTCPKPIAPENAVISRLTVPRFYDMAESDVFDKREYQENDEVYFQCKDGFTPAGNVIMYITCTANGTWFPDARKVWACVSNRRLGNCGQNMFACRSNRKCILAARRCDCVSDCDDGSDELRCDTRRRIIFARSSGRDSAGVITNPGYPLLYPGNFSCVYDIVADAKHRVQVDFEEFELRPKESGKCVDFVRITGIKPTYLRNRSHSSKLLPREKFADLSETRCGNDKFSMLISNGSGLSIQIQLNSHSAWNLRGLSLLWQVKREDETANYPDPNSVGETELAATRSPSLSSEAVYTVLTPIAIAAMLPLSLIFCFCCHRRLRRNSKDGVISCLRPAKPTNEFVEVSVDVRPLTEENLTHYNCELARHSSGREVCSLLSELPMRVDCRSAQPTGRQSLPSATGDSGKPSDFFPLTFTSVPHNDREAMGTFFQTANSSSRSRENYRQWDMLHVSGMSPQLLRASPVGMSSNSSDMKRSMVSRSSTHRVGNVSSSFASCPSHLVSYKDLDAFDSRATRDCSKFCRSAQNSPSAGNCPKKGLASSRTSKPSVGSSSSVLRDESSSNFGTLLLC